MRIVLNIGKKIIGIILIVAIIAIVVIIAAYLGGYFGKPLAYGSEREASEAITNMSSSIDQIKSIIEDIDRRLGR